MLRSELSQPLRLLLLFAGLAALSGCKNRTESQPDAAAGRGADAATGNTHPAQMRAAAIAHGGVGSPPEMRDGPRRAVDAALAALERGADPLDAALAGAVVLEDDPHYNAGTGSRVRIDGETVQMDAALMNSEGRFGAV